MVTNKRLSDLIDYTTVLPYDSELFGIYQPLIGWKSKRMASRIDAGFLNDKREILEAIKKKFSGIVAVEHDDASTVNIDIERGVAQPSGLKEFDSVVLKTIADRLPSHDQLRPSTWQRAINPARIDAILNDTVVPTYSTYYSDQVQAQLSDHALLLTGRKIDPDKQKRLFSTAFESQLRYESAISAALLFLRDNRSYQGLETLFYAMKDNDSRAAELARILAAAEPTDAYLDLSSLNPRDQEQLRRVALSPISVVHLFRQYFFELDTFLGPPVEHVWLSPGSTVELIEVHTRRTITEKTLETALETTTKTETETTNQDEISDAVKQDNKQDIKFGASVTASYASVSATSSFDYASSQQTAREETHKRMRQQTEKLSTEIRKNYKTTFRTVTEVTDSSSKRYVLSNNTAELINYELRRKMRQIAVQVQDVGSYLCWQTHVDRPGESLGVAKLLHIAVPAELEGLHAPDEIPMLQPFPEEKIITLPFISIENTDADNEDEVYKDGVEVDNSEVFGNLEKIQSDFLIECICPRGNYVLTDVEFDSQGKPILASRKGDILNADNKSLFTLHLNSVDFQSQNSIQVKLTLHWSPAPGANDEAIRKNRENTDDFKSKEAVEYQKAFVQSAKERIKLTHQIKARPSDDLREEERIVVYRKLIQELLTNGVDTPDDRTRHVIAEVISSIFDIDKMLYFVAPEWWRPRLYSYSRQLTETRAVMPSHTVGIDPFARGMAKQMVGISIVKPTDRLSAHTVGWGGVNDPNRDSYYITEDSDPARFGSSLGWLLQLDGDNLRNAFLNAPWVKAVIPIRPGKEEAAINWLKGVEGLNGITDKDIYQTNNPNEKDINGNPLNGQKMMKVILDLAKKVQKKHAEAVKNGQYPKQDEIADPALVDQGSVVTSTPIDRVYEHGFYPLQGGFRANVKGDYEIFDQWLEVLPTEQVVPVEVKYDPKTGRQV